MPVPGQWAMLKATYKATTIYIGKVTQVASIGSEFNYKAYKLTEVSQRLEIHISEGRVAYQTTRLCKDAKDMYFCSD